MPQKSAEKPGEKKIPSPLLKEEVRRELKKDGFDYSLYPKEHQRLDGKLLYYDKTWEEAIGTLETMRETMRSALKEIEGIRKAPKSMVSKRERSDPFFKAEINEYLLGIRNALSEIEERLEIARKGATVENRVLDDLSESGFDIDELDGTLNPLYEKVSIEPDPEQRRFTLAAMINEIETAIFEIERIRKNPASLVAKHEKSDAAYKNAVSRFISGLRDQQKELERMHESGNVEMSRF